MKSKVENKKQGRLGPMVAILFYEIYGQTLRVKFLFIKSRNLYIGIYIWVMGRI